MTVSISCKEVGVDCPFVTGGETGEVAIDSLMRHVGTEHSEDWFEIEEIYQAACQVCARSYEVAHKGSGF